ncbi:MAG: hypothetical protein OXM57_14300 [bacterium]|nr:hypothetical protein [bacterium]
MGSKRHHRATAAAAAGTDAFRAFHGDVVSAGRLVWSVLRSRWLRRLVAVFAVVIGTLGLVLFDGEPLNGTSRWNGTAGLAFGVPPRLWVAYQASSRVWCLPSGEVALSGEPMAAPWMQTDWRLVAAVGRVESAHASGVEIDAFGDTSPWFFGPMLDGSNPQWLTVSDSDGGRWDLTEEWDRAVGPMQLLPQTVASHGIDGNGDGIVSPHNVWDAAASAAYYLCVAGGSSRDRVQALFAYNRSEEYVRDVLGFYAEFVNAELPAETTPRFPAGAPLAYVPPLGPVADISGDGSPQPALRAFLHRLGRGEFLEDVEVVCAGDGGCVWTADRGTDWVGQWDGLRKVGFAGPVRFADLGVAVLGEAARYVRVAPLPNSGGELSWPVALRPPPQPSRAAPPAWFSAHVPMVDGSWTAPGDMVVLPTVPGQWVFAPTEGTVRVDGRSGCVIVVDGEGWTWSVCGVATEHRTGKAPAGVGIASAEGEVALRLVSPEGRDACLQRLFGLWSADRAVTPGQLDRDIKAWQARAVRLAADALAERVVNERLELAVLAAEARAETDRLERALYESCRT